MNRRIPNGTYGGVRGRGLAAPSYSIPCSPLFKEMELEYELNDAGAETLVALDVLYPVAQKVLANTAVKRVITSNLNDFLPEEPTLPITDVMKIKKSPIPGTTDLMDILANGDNRSPDVKVELDDLALLQYTGGTTGLPKGAMLTQFAALFKSATAYANARVVDSDSIVLAIAPIFHIAGMLVGVDAPILTGATVVLLVGFDPETAMMAIEKYRINYFTATVPMNVAIMSHPNVGKYDLSSLKHPDYVLWHNSDRGDCQTVGGGDQRRDPGGSRLRIE